MTPASFVCPVQDAAHIGWGYFYVVVVQPPQTYLVLHIPRGASLGALIIFAHIRIGGWAGDADSGCAKPPSWGATVELALSRWGDSVISQFAC